MIEKIYVFGHKSPDTDSVCSSIAYADLKRKIGYKNIEAYRLGSLNKETEFVLNYFNIKHPDLLETVKEKLDDLELQQPMILSRDASFKDAITLFKNIDESSLISVVDQSDNIEGIISMNDLTNVLLQTSSDTLTKGNQYEIIFQNLINILDIQSIHGSYNYKKIEGNIYADYIIEQPEKLTDKDILITNNIDLAKDIIKNFRCGCVVLTDSIVAPKLEDNIGCIVSVNNPFSNITTCINQSISISSLTNNDNIHFFLNTTSVSEAIKQTQSLSYKSFPVVDKQGSVIGILDKNHLLQNKKKSVILVDHNESSQSVDGIEQSKILEIVDHHRVDGIKTEAPIYIRIEPVGCTSTIIYKMFLEANVEIDKNIAGLMLSAILSDTLIFTSPTCTQEDITAGKELAKIANINCIESYGKEMFMASTSLEGLTPDEIISIDRKRFSFGSNSSFISQVNTLNIKEVLELKHDLFKAMDAAIEKHGINLFLVMITDLETNGSEILIRGSACNLAREAFGIDPHEDSIFIEGVVSRKKQIIPKLTLIAKNY